MHIRSGSFDQKKFIKDHLPTKVTKTKNKVWKKEKIGKERFCKLYKIYLFDIQMDQHVKLKRG